MIITGSMILNDIKLKNEQRKELKAKFNEDLLKHNWIVKTEPCYKDTTYSYIEYSDGCENFNLLDRGTKEIMDYIVQVKNDNIEKDIDFLLDCLELRKILS